LEVRLCHRLDNEIKILRKEEETATLAL
jgi:hypothetical protein